MVQEFSRAQRVSRELQKEISIILQRKIQDPRVGIAIVSSVKLSNDLVYAKVFVTFLNKFTQDEDQKKIKSAMKALQDATSYIRSLIGKVMKLRVVPTLIFYYDKSHIEGVRIANLVTNVVKNDMKICKRKDKNNEEIS